jgi:hypothetical protein
LTSGLLGLHVNKKQFNLIIIIVIIIIIIQVYPGSKFDLYVLDAQAVTLLACIREKSG